jgi:hypothetical protein
VEQNPPAYNPDTKKRFGDEYNALALFTKLEIVMLHRKGDRALTFDESCLQSVV